MKFLNTVLFFVVASTTLALVNLGQQELVPLVAHAKVIPCTTVKDCSQHITAHSHLICKDHQCRSKCNTGYLATTKGKYHLILCDPKKCTQAIPKKSTHTCVANKCSYACDPDHHFNGVSCVTSSCKDATSCHLTLPHHSTATCLKNICSFACNDGYTKTGTYCKQNSAMTCTAASQCLVKGPLNSSVYCHLGKCGIACNTGYQESTDKSSCVKNPTHCLKTVCQTLTHGQVKCKNNNVCTYSCNAEAGYTLHTEGTTSSCFNYSDNSKNCGAFGTVCPPTAPTCVKGVCTKPQ